MKTELREVTVQKEFYIACDGTAFEDEDECGTYELDILEKSLECYDSNYNRTNVEACAFANLKTKKEVKTFREVCNLYGIVDDGIDGPGIYVYDNVFKDRWLNIDTIISHIRGESKEN